MLRWLSPPHLSPLCLSLLLAAPSADAQSPAPAAAPEAPLVRVYGTILPRVVVATSALESFGQPNEVAVTAAGNAALTTRPEEARFSFQAQQSRVGLWVNEQGTVRGQLEVDFTDFSKATPTTQVMARLRIARADWKVTAEDTLSLGQDWDLHTPLNPFTLNLVGNLFQSGNAGFMRQQLRYVHTGQGVDWGVAVGFPGPNALARDSMLELGAPTLAVRGALLRGKSRVGVGALLTRLTFQGTGGAEDRHALAGQLTLYAEWIPSASTTLRVELNAGQDTANLGLLTLAQGSFAADNQEAGGFVSVRHVLSERHAVYASAGFMRLLTPGDAVPSYGYAPTPEGTPAPAVGTGTLTSTGPGLVRNGSVRVGYEYRPSPQLALVLEPFLLQSRHVLQAVDVGRVPAVTTGMGVETGMLFTF